MNVRLGPTGRVLHGLVIALGLMLPLLAGCGNDELTEHLERGRSLFRNEQFEEAQLEGLYVLLREPENEEALHLVALSLLSQNRDGEAEGYFRNLAGISREYAEEAAALYDAKAREDYSADEKNRAARRWGMALSFNPSQDLGPHAFFMAQRAYEARLWQRAATLYSQALAGFPDSSAVGRALYPYGVSLHRLERFDEALNVLEPFLRSFPRHRRHHEAVWLYQELLIHEARGAHVRMDYERAVALLRKALRYDDNPPKTAEALLELGQNYEQLQDYGAAVSCYQRIVEANTAGSGRIYGSALARLEKTGEGEVAVKGLFTIRLCRSSLLLMGVLLVCACSSSEKLGHREKGDKAFAEGDYAEAVQEYQVYLEEGFAQGDAMLAQFMLARSYFENQDYPTAAVEFEIFQRDYPRSDSLEAAAYYESLSHVKQSPDYDRDSSLTVRAIRMLEDFILDYPGSSYLPWAREQIRILNEKLARKSLETARLYESLRQRRAAGIYYEKLLREYPQSEYWDEGVIELIELRLAEGDLPEARYLAELIASERPGSDLNRRAEELLAREP